MAGAQIVANLRLDSSRLRADVAKALGVVNTGLNNQSVGGGGAFNNRVGFLGRIGKSPGGTDVFLEALARSAPQAAAALGAVRLATVALDAANAAGAAKRAALLGDLETQVKREKELNDLAEDIPIVGRAGRSVRGALANAGVSLPRFKAFGLDFGGAGEDEIAIERTEAATKAQERKNEYLKRRADLGREFFETSRKLAREAERQNAQATMSPLRRQIAQAKNDLEDYREVLEKAMKAQGRFKPTETEQRALDALQQSVKLAGRGRAEQADALAHARDVQRAILSGGSSGALAAGVVHARRRPDKASDLYGPLAAANLARQMNQQAQPGTDPVADAKSRAMRDARGVAAMNARDRKELASRHAAERDQIESTYSSYLHPYLRGLGMKSNQEFVEESVRPRFEADRARLGQSMLERTRGGELRQNRIFRYGNELATRIRSLSAGGAAVTDLVPPAALNRKGGKDLEDAAKELKDAAKELRGARTVGVVKD
jgi:hypothetical protein